eukprot:1499662-Amphidinium_carterae.1
MAIVIISTATVFELISGVGVGVTGGLYERKFPRSRAVVSTGVSNGTLQFWSTQNSQKGAPGPLPQPPLPGCDYHPTVFNYRP